MANFHVDQSFWEVFPEAKIGVVLLKDYDGKSANPAVQDFLMESHEIAQQYLVAEQFSDNSVIQTYRQAYQQFKTKKGARSSIEALLKRVSTGKTIGSINPLVDLYNGVSLRYALPVGAEDIETFEGDLRLTVTEGDDDFYLIGDDRNQPTLAGEICYKDDKGAVCRCLNWRDGERTMITDQTTKAFLVIELLDVSRLAVLEEALGTLVKLSEELLGAEARSFVLDSTCADLSLEV